MNISMEQIEKITSQQLRQLPLHDRNIYSLEDLECLEEEDIIDPEEGGFMRGYLSQD